MPISAKKFEQDGVPAENRQRGERQLQVMQYLQHNPETAYTQSEVAKALGLSTPQQARSCLLALEAKGKVVRQAIGSQIYYMIDPAYAPKKTTPKK